jgi:hypothetical protein
MLSPSTVDEIGRLLEEGKLSRRQIAARLSVSRGSIGAIARGQRVLTRKEASERGQRAAIAYEYPKRCPGCGYRVHLPCLICMAREFRQSLKTPGAKPASTAKRLARRSRYSRKGNARRVLAGPNF